MPSSTRAGTGRTGKPAAPGAVAPATADPSACVNPADLRDWLYTLAQQLRFNGARYIHIGRHGPDQTAGDLQHHQPLRFLTAPAGDPSDVDEWIARDPCAAAVRIAFAPFAYIPRITAGLSACKRAWLEQERARGNTGYLILPVQDSVHGPAYISLFGNGSTQARRLAEQCAPELAFAAAQFHARAKQVLPMADWMPRLSQRELECLELAASGKTLAQSGSIVGLSERTVEYHLRNASEKLGASTKLRAVVLAMRYGLI